MPLRDQVVGQVRRPLLVLSGAVTLVLLIACANVANLQLARAIARQRETAVRVALGAGTRQTGARSVLTESVALACTGGLAGVAVGVRGRRLAYVRWRRNSCRASTPIAVDGAVLAFTRGAARLRPDCFSGWLPLPARRMPTRSTRCGRAGAAPRDAASLWGRGHRVRAALVIGEIALAVMLVAGAGLLVRSVAGLRDVDRPGSSPTAY